MLKTEDLVATEVVSEIGKNLQHFTSLPIHMPICLRVILKNHLTKRFNIIKMNIP